MTSRQVRRGQALEREAGFVGRVTGGDVAGRDLDDVGESALPYAEVKALATGNPLVIEQAGVQAERAAVVAALVVVGCGSDDDTDDPAAPSSSPSTSASGTAAETTEQATSTPPPPAEVVTAGPVTILTNEYGLPDTTGWDTVAVFDLTNTGEYVTAVPYRVTVSSADGATTAASDGSDAVILSPGETVTVVEDDLDPTGPSPPSQGEVTVYGPASGPAAGLVGEPEWASSNELFDCNNGLVGYGITGDRRSRRRLDSTAPGSRM